MQSGGEANHLRVHVGVDLLDPVGRGIGQPDLIPHADQEARRTCGRVGDCFAASGIDQPDQSADDRAGRAERAGLARLPNLAERVLEEVALGVRVPPVEMRVVQLADDLGEHRRLVDDRPSVVRGVEDAALSNSRKPGKVGDPLYGPRVRRIGPY